MNIYIETQNLQVIATVFNSCNASVLHFSNFKYSLFDKKKKHAICLS